MVGHFTKRRGIAVGVFCLIAMSISSYALLAVANSTSYEQALMHYERNETDKAIKLFKELLSATFTEPVTGALQQAINLAKSGKADEAENPFLSLFEDEETAARARYELGLIYESQGKLDAAATMFRDTQAVIASNGAVYVGISNCKRCHLKLYKSWKKTKAANSFNSLKPGVKAEIKTKLKFDPQKDYTKDASCLTCHTTGFGLPGGYKIPERGNLKSARRAKENAGITCEGCHGPGSKYIPVFKAAMTKKRKYTQKKVCDLGMFEVGAKVCTTCHNLRNTTNEPDYHFNFAEHKAKDTHAHFPLRYRTTE